MIMDTTALVMRPEATKFGRLYSPDPRDVAYPMSRIPRAALVMERHWRTGQFWDQGEQPACVGYTGRHFLEAAPVMARIGRELPHPMLLYVEAQRNDEFYGENYDGTTARGLMKYMKDVGLISGYLWGSRIEHVRDFLLVRGPVCAGTEWFVDMTVPRRVSGRYPGLYLEPKGEWQGGHEYLLTGYSRKRNAFRMMNSWSAKWGEGGRAWIDYDVMNTLLFQMNGDAVSAMEVVS